MVERNTTTVVNPVDFTVRVVKHELSRENFANYVIKVVVVGPRDISFELKDRYSSIREFQALVKRNIGSADGTPPFPKKKYIGNMEPAFLSQREQQLSLFLQTFLAHPLVKVCPLVPVYFASKASGQESKAAVKSLVDYMSGTTNKPAAPQRFVGQIDHMGGPQMSQDHGGNQSAQQNEPKLLKPVDANQGSAGNNNENGMHIQQRTAQQQSDQNDFKEKYNAQGWSIVEEMQDKFIDLCVDDNHSVYDNDMPHRQENFRAHLEKLDFRFQTTSMDMPAPMASAADQIDTNRYAEIMTADTDMGNDLDAIFEMIGGQQAKEQFKADPVIIEHSWNDNEKKFIMQN